MITEALWMILIAAASFFAGHELGAWLGWRRGFKAGRNVERSHTNGLVIAGRLDACKKQAIRYRALFKGND